MFKRLEGTIIWQVERDKAPADMPQILRELMNRHRDDDYQIVADKNHVTMTLLTKKDE